MRPFILFDQIHWYTLIFTYGVITILTLWIKSQPKENIKYARFSVGVLLLTHAFMQIFNAYSYQLAWQEALPLHMCDFSKIAIALYLLGYGTRFFQCAFFWGIIPASMALFTPALKYTFPHPEYVNFYYGHGLILLGIAIAMFVSNERPYFKDFMFVIGLTVLLTPIIYIANLILGAEANFWYLMDKPKGDTIMNLFPDAPLHVFVLIPTAIFAFFLTYLPFLIKDNLLTKKDN
ncbi:uncharacterized protein METZ01_LOCUS445534 [marine metagenome]|uniref:TIGR02206 family membrane protein n=1 Tax=marine metagenome TaxID=408172 RepID=A0A382ZBN9_9ZZZZ